jgi:uncharacterized protein
MAKFKHLDLESLAQIIREISAETSIYIGCDSQKHKKNGQWYASYSRVVVLHIDSNKGCRVFGDVVKLPDYGSLRQRLMQEVYFSTEIAMQLADAIGERHFEVHLDINKKQGTGSSVVIKEAMGYVRGMLGIDATIKPDAAAASYAADTMVRGRPI